MSASTKKFVRVLAPLMLAALMLGLSVVLLTTMVSAKPEPAATASPGSDNEARNTLRIYGRCDENAVFPYGTITGPLSIQSCENPPKDFVVWNPAYLDHFDLNSAGMYGNFYWEIKANNVDANEKVHLRQWYVPKYEEPSGLVWEKQTPITSPAIVKEYTYILLDTEDGKIDNPTYGLPGQTNFVFPTARAPADTPVGGFPLQQQQIGLCDYNVNNYDVGGIPLDTGMSGFADEADIVHLETISNTVPPGSMAAYWTDGTFKSGAFEITTCLGITASVGAPWIDISAGSTGEFMVEEDDVIRFLDHMVVVKECYESWGGPGAGVILVDVYYTGNSSEQLLPEGVDDLVHEGETLTSGRHEVNEQTLTNGDPPSQSAQFLAGTSFLKLVRQPWYLQVLSVSDTDAQVKVGRLLAQGESFFVNAAEYEIAKIHKVTDPATGEEALKYITVRNALPKCEEGEDCEVHLPDLSIKKQAFAPQDPLPFLPPFNMEHDMVDDVNIPDNITCSCCDLDSDNAACHPDYQYPDNVWDGAEEESPCDAGDTGYGSVSHLCCAYNMIADRVIMDVAAIVEYYEQEEKEPRFDTNLLEEKFKGEWDEEYWMWKNIETLPWDYTELVLPLLPDITDRTNNDDGDYILVGSWMTEDDVRMKFAFDAALGAVNSADIYVNDDAYNNQYLGVDKPSLRVYGACDNKATFPYMTTVGPLSIQSPENPPKDFIVWNPAYMSYADYGIFVNGSDANQKVHLRQWYTPKYCEPSGMVWIGQTPVTRSHIVKEYTYIFLDTDNDPKCGAPGNTNFMFPIADNLPQIGLDSFDMDGDGEDDLVRLETISNTVPPTTVVYLPCQLGRTVAVTLPYTTGIAGDFGRPWIDISTGEFMVRDESPYPEIRFLDYMVRIKSINYHAQPPHVDVDLYYLGNQSPVGLGDFQVPMSRTLSAGKRGQHVETLGGSPPAPPSQSSEFIAGTSHLELVNQPWYLQVRDVASGDRANIVVGRLLAQGESFFVDGAEYEVAKIHKETKEEGTEALKYITLRNALPKGADVFFDRLSIQKHGFDKLEELPFLPPFNRTHTIVDDVNIPDCITCDPNDPCHPDWQYRDNVVGEAIVATGVCKDHGVTSHLHKDYNTIAERLVEGQAPVVEYYITETKEIRFDTNLLEEKITGTVDNEGWMWKNIETLPWDYTEFVLPEIDDITDEGDYILVSSFTTEDCPPLDLGANVTGTAECSTERAHSRMHSAKLTHGGPPATAGSVYVQFTTPPPVTLADFQADINAGTPEYSFWYWLHTGLVNGPQFELRFEDPDPASLGWAEITAVGLQWPIQTGAWLKETLDGATKAGFGGWDSAGTWFFDWSLTKDLSTILADVNGALGVGTADAWQLTRVRVELWEASGSYCYIDDVTVNDLTYDLETRVKFYYDAAFSPDEKTGLYVNTPVLCWCFGDFNGDDFRDGQDLMLMVQAWNTEVGDPKYEPRFDVDHDGDIDITDLMLVAAVWNTPCP